MHRCKRIPYFSSVLMWGFNTASSIHNGIRIWKGGLHWIQRRTLFQWSLCSVGGPSLLFMFLSPCRFSEVSLVCGMREEIWACVPDDWMTAVFQGFFIIIVALLLTYITNHILMGSIRTSLIFIFFFFVVRERIIFCNICWADVL